MAILLRDIAMARAVPFRGQDIDRNIRLASTRALTRPGRKLVTCDRRQFL
jgi:hypothetical protein